jgi:hypothetical protein
MTRWVKARGAACGKLRLRLAQLPRLRHGRDKDLPSSRHFILHINRTMRPSLL